VFLPCTLLHGISKISVYEVSYSNELKLFNGDSIILYLTYVAVIIECQRGEAYGVYRENECWSLAWKQKSIEALGVEGGIILRRMFYKKNRKNL
jgi:hypothetical protein